MAPPGGHWRRYIFRRISLRCREVKLGGVGSLKTPTIPLGHEERSCFRIIMLWIAVTCRIGGETKAVSPEARAGGGSSSPASRGWMDDMDVRFTRLDGCDGCDGCDGGDGCEIHVKPCGSARASPAGGMLAGFGGRPGRSVSTRGDEPCRGGIPQSPSPRCRLRRPSRPPPAKTAAIPCRERMSVQLWRPVIF